MSGGLPFAPPDERLLDHVLDVTLDPFAQEV